MFYCKVFYLNIVEDDICTKNVHYKIAVLILNLTKKNEFTFYIIFSKKLFI